MSGPSRLIRWSRKTRWLSSAAGRTPMLGNVARRSFISEASAPLIKLPKPDSSQLTGVTSRTPDASFEVLGSPFSVLSAKLAPSQTLYTRRGTLVALTGNPENAVSTLSVLSPFLRASSGVPFLYQQITSTSPFTAIIGTNSSSSSFTTVHLDGRADWVIAQRAALQAWTGLNLIVKPKINYRMSMGHWGSSHITGRGLIGLVGKGQVYQINLGANEDYVVSPKHVLAYSVNDTAPQPYRFKSTALRFQIPSVTSIIPDTRFFREMRGSSVWQTIAGLTYTLRTWARRSIWGDRLFLKFQGPATILLQSRASKITESLTSQDVNEIADAPAGALLSNQIAKAVAPPPLTAEPSLRPKPAPEKPTTVKTATMGADGKFKIQ